MAMPLVKNDRRYTYEDYLGWDDETRWELIDGIAYAMAPAPAVLHQAFVTGLAAQTWTALKGKPCQVFVSPIDVRLQPIAP